MSIDDPDELPYEDLDESISIEDLEELDLDAVVVDDDVHVEDLDEVQVIISTPEDRERLLAEAMAHAEIQDAQYKQPLPETVRTGHWKTPLAFVVLLLAGYIGIAPPAWLSDNPPPVLAESELERGVITALEIQAEQIRVFRERNGRLPRTLDELPTHLPMIRYVRSNNRVFQLIAPRPNGTLLLYDAANPDPRFEEAGAPLFGEEPGS